MLSSSWGTITARKVQGWKWNGLDRSYCSWSHQCWWTENLFYSCTTNQPNSSPLETGLHSKSVLSTPFSISGKCQVLSGRVALPISAAVLRCHTATVRAALKIWYCSSGEPIAKEAECSELSRSTSWSWNNSIYFSFIVDNHKCCFKDAKVMQPTVTHLLHFVFLELCSLCFSCSICPAPPGLTHQTEEPQNHHWALCPSLGFQGREQRYWDENWAFDSLNTNYSQVFVLFIAVWVICTQLIKNHSSQI